MSARIEVTEEEAAHIRRVTPFAGAAPRLSQISAASLMEWIQTAAIPHGDFQCLVIRATRSPTREPSTATVCLEDRAACARTAAQAAHSSSSTTIRPILRSCKILEPGLEFYTHRGIIALTPTLRAISNAFGAAQAAQVRVRDAQAESGNNPVPNAFADEGMPSVRAPGLCLGLALQAASPCRAVWVICGRCRHPRLVNGESPSQLPNPVRASSAASHLPTVPSDWHVSFLSTRRPAARSRSELATRRTVLARDTYAAGGVDSSRPLLTDRWPKVWTAGPVRSPPLCSQPAVAAAGKPRGPPRRRTTPSRTPNSLQINPRVLDPVSIINKLRGGVFSTTSVIDLLQMLVPEWGKGSPGTSLAVPDRESALRDLRNAVGLDALLLGIAMGARTQRGTSAGPGGTPEIVPEHHEPRLRQIFPYAISAAPQSPHRRDSKAAARRSDSVGGGFVVRPAASLASRMRRGGPETSQRDAKRCPAALGCDSSGLSTPRTMVFNISCT
ncbi:hypothetical protein AURDEDRAFT_177922 [Auricularia subglabra TFB-10046 SS5]|uniref:Uncharacterized protein n=1 Tax=Auricularia subglabra (strain TFB-10046 / SS5) TaxID=717982 RepID=J0WL18_AURST|nr:hypothetical protein AURDEDRAFT_177922 [Auricularia subglabra TFB-10046 SS5]